MAALGYPLKLPLQISTQCEHPTWGKLVSITGIMKDTIGVDNPFRYRSYYYDTETGLYYLNSRYYDPETCRFLNADTPEILFLTGGELLGTNIFAYCNNNPVINSDPTGHWAQNYAGFKWRNNGKSFSVNIHWNFLSKAFCLAYAWDIIAIKGTWYWWGKGYSGMSATDLAAEFFTHALLYYFSNITIRYFNRGYNWNLSGKIIDIDAGDWRKWQFNAVWWGSWAVQAWAWATLRVWIPM